MKKDRYIPGDHNIIDDMTGEKVKASQTRLRWDGVVMKAEDWEPRHPQDFLRNAKDRIKVDGPVRVADNTNFFVSRSASDVPFGK